MNGDRETLHRVVIVGGGFGGLSAARALKREPVHVTLLDRRNFHLFQPLLYQVATGILCPGEIAAPLRHILRGSRNTVVLLGEAVGFDPAERRVLLADGELAYDSLIVAAGSVNQYYGHDDWAAIAPGLKSIEDCAEIRQKIFYAFEVAEREADPVKRRAWLTFVVVGSGATGVELSGMISEIARDSLRGDFRSIRPEEAEILLVDLADRVLPHLPPELSRKAEESLRRVGVKTQTGVRVTCIDTEGVVLDSSNGSERIEARTVLWTAGVSGSPLAERLAEKTGACLDRQGRLKVQPDLTLPGYPEIFVVGDLARIEGPDGSPLPGLAPVATQSGRYAARRIAARIRGEGQGSPFSYFDKGVMAVIGRHAAVADIGRFHFGGILAWFLWLFIHLLLLVGFENRLIVFTRWAFAYFTFNRGSRILYSEGTVRLPLSEIKNTD